MEIKKLAQLLLWICACLGSQAWALEITVAATNVSVSPLVEVLEDPTHALSLEEVSAPEMAARFQPQSATGEDFNVGMSASTYWLRFRLQRTTDTPNHWLLEVPYGNLTSLSFYAPGQPAVHTGSLFPLASRPYFHRYFVFPLDLEETPADFYISATSSYALTVPVRLHEAAAFAQKEHRDLALQYLYYGSVLALLLYNLFLFAGLRDVRLLLYSGYVATFGMGIYAGNGLGRLVLWPDSPRFDEIAQGALLCLATVFAAEFARVFLKTRSRFKVVDKLLLSSAVVCLLICAGLIASMGSTTAVSLLNRLFASLTVLTVFIILVACAKAWASGEREVRFFLLAWFALSLGGLVAALRAFGYLPTNGLTAYALQIASAIEMLLFSLALADSMHTERERMQQSLSAALATQKKSNDMLHRSEERLERTVAQRTHALSEALTSQKETLAQYVRFGSLISHEFRNPLAIVSGQLSLLRKEAELGTPRWEQRSRVMLAALKRLDALFEQWLRKGRLEGSLETIHKEPIDLCQWLRQWMEDNALATDHQIRLELAGGMHTIWADPGLLANALGNLLENACKYSPIGTVVSISIHRRPGQVGIAVADEGAGIADDQQQKVFEAFYRVAPEGPVNGMGLGLNLVKRIVEAHMGEIELASTLGQGSRFCIWLPHEPTAAQEPSTCTATAKPEFWS